MAKSQSKPTREYSDSTWALIRSHEIPTPDADVLCLYRSCYGVGEDKGSYSVGRGYTSYHTEPRPVCMTRLCHGCPSGPLIQGVVQRPLPDLAKVETGTAARLLAKGVAAQRRAREHVRGVVKLLSIYAIGSVKGD